MALGATTYKTPNAINLIGSDMTDKEGCGVRLPVQGGVMLATATTHKPYGIIVTGTDSVTPGSYPSAIGNAALELVDQLGCVVQVSISGTSGVSAGDFLLMDEANYGDGRFTNTATLPPAAGDWIWGLALTNAGTDEQCLMRFQPYQIQYIAP